MENGSHLQALALILGVHLRHVHLGCPILVYCSLLSNIHNSLAGLVVPKRVK